MHPKQILDFYQIDPKKSLGQNFLFDEGVLQRIVAAADTNKNDQVLEIGPGLGALTRQLAGKANQVIAVEIDGRLFPILERELSDFANVDLILGDILQQNLADLFTGPYKVVANVPYYITGAILRFLYEAEIKPSVTVLTVQKEVAERLTAVPPKMSLLSVSIQYYGQPQIISTTKAGAFWPRPDVDSAIVRIDLHEENALLAPDLEKTFFRLARAGFSQKRKQLQKNLRQLGLDRQEINRILGEVGIDGRRRAETLTLQEWHSLTKKLSQK